VRKMKSLNLYLTRL